MKIECPECKYGGEVDDIKIPDAGIWGTCKKCKTRFFVKKETDVKPDAQGEFQIVTTNPTVFCPKCGIEQTHTEKCSACGIVIPEYISTRLKNEAQYQKVETSSLTSDKVTWWKRRSYAVFGIIVICFVSVAIVVRNIIAESNRKAVIAGIAAERERLEKAERERPIYTDQQTGLTWIKNGNISDKIMNWEKAMSWVKNLNYGGFSDWRLPSKEELETFAKRGGSSPFEWFNANGFNMVQADYYWTSTSTYDYGTIKAWVTNMGKSSASGYNGTTDNFYVWPVRGGQSVDTEKNQKPDSPSLSPSSPSINQFDFSNKQNPFKPYIR